MRIFILVICNFFLFHSLIFSQPNSLYPKYENGKWGYVNNKSKVVVKYKYIQAEPFCEGLALVRELNSSNLVYKYIDATGYNAFPDEFLNASSFNEGLAYVSKSEKYGYEIYGYINTKGKLVIPYKYTIAEKFSNGFAVVGKDNPSEHAYGEGVSIFGIINKNDSLLANRWFSSVTRISKDTFIVTIKNEKYALFSNGEMVLKENKIVNYIDTSTEFNRLLTYKKEVTEKIGVSSTDTSSTDIVNFYKVETRPEFPGGIEAMIKWIAENVKYPEIAKEKSIQGKVFVEFIIGKDGKVRNVKVIKGANPLLDQEAIRLISSMSAWKPGKQSGKIVNVSFQIPINFKLF